MNTEQQAFKDAMIGISVPTRWKHIEEPELSCLQHLQASHLVLALKAILPKPLRGLFQQKSADASCLDVSRSTQTKGQASIESGPEETLCGHDLSIESPNVEARGAALAASQRSGLDRRVRAD